MGTTQPLQKYLESALENGIPIFQEGLQILYRSIKKNELDDYLNSRKLQEAYCRSIKETLWSVRFS